MLLSRENNHIWYDGKFVNYSDANTHVLTHSLHYGMGVFEGLRAYLTDKGSAIFRLNEHTDRLFNSAKILDIKIPFSKEEINLAHKLVVKKNNFQECYIRPLVFYGSEKLGIYPPDNDVHVIIAAWTWGNYLGNKSMVNGIKVKISSYSKYNANSILCKSKTTGNYLNSILSNKEAVKNGFDEAILLDSQGFVAEGSGENVFLVKNGKLYTPDSASSILDGITRDSVIDICDGLSLEVIEKKVTRDELYIADEVFFTGTAAQITPINQVDNISIGNGTVGDITREIQDVYFDIVHGNNAKYTNWLSYL